MANSAQGDLESCLQQVHARNPRTLNELINIVHTERNAIDHDESINLTHIMNTCLNIAIENKGGAAKYEK